MIAQERRNADIVSCFLKLDEEPRCAIACVVAGCQVANRVFVGLSLLVATVREAHELLENGGVDVVARANRKGQEDESGKRLDAELFLKTNGAVPVLGMGDLVSEDARKMILLIEILDEPRVDVDVATWRTENFRLSGGFSS